MDKETLVVIFWALRMGGIETNAVQIMKNALSNKRRTIWVGDRRKEYTKVFGDVIENHSLEYVPMDIHHIDLYRIPPISFQPKEKVTFVTFSLYDCYKALKYRRKYPKNQISVICVVPHFTSPAVLLEQTLHKPLQGLAKSICGKIYKELYDNGSLHFFSDAHPKALISNYHISLPDYNNKVIRNLCNLTSFDIEQRRVVYRHNSKFRIISAGRFEFPHKGFLVGLIKEFAKLSIKYPQLELLIVGEGAGKETLDEIMNSLPEAVKEKIYFRKPVSPDLLLQLMLGCNLNISVAGCASLGAKAGVLTLPARHYTYDCEVYGFIPESADKTTSSDPGFPVSEYIEKAINMTEDEYVSACENSYNWYRQFGADLNYPFDTIQNISYYPSRFYFIFIRLMFLRYRLAFLLKRLFG